MKPLIPNSTALMNADDIAQAFNGAAEREYWHARVGGTPALRTVNFNSAISMTQFVYYVKSGAMAVVFRKTECPFGDYTASIYRSLVQILTTLKAAGLEIEAPLSDGQLRMEYEPTSKQCYVHLAHVDDDWREAEPLVFKVVEK